MTKLINKKALKVCICGTFCAGKSTLSSELKNTLPNSKLVVDAARELISTIPTIRWDLPSVREYLLTEQILRERRAECSNHKYIIVDGGVIGNLAHDRLFNYCRPDGNQVIDTLGHTPYDLVVYCDHTKVTLVADGQRLTDHSLREQLAKNVWETMYEVAIKHVTVQGNVQTRLKDVVTTLNCLDKSKG